ERGEPLCDRLAPVPFGKGIGKVRPGNHERFGIDAHHDGALLRPARLEQAVGEVHAVASDSSGPNSWSPRNTPSTRPLIVAPAKGVLRAFDFQAPGSTTHSGSGLKSSISQVSPSLICGCSSPSRARGRTLI